MEGDPKQLAQALLHVCQNAIDATRTSGGVRVATSTYCAKADVTEPSATFRLEPGAYVCVEVEDTGVGMNAEVRAHALEPFYTTKDGAAGLGLSMVFGVIRHHGGDLIMTSAAGDGTTVRLFLPVRRVLRMTPSSLEV